jgi:hypothetical protein
MTQRRPADNEPPVRYRKGRRQREGDWDGYERPGDINLLHCLGKRESGPMLTHPLTKPATGEQAVPGRGCGVGGLTGIEAGAGAGAVDTD